jgi:hypothetical protein
MIYEADPRELLLNKIRLETGDFAFPCLILDRGHLRSQDSQGPHILRAMEAEKNVFLVDHG